MNLITVTTYKDMKVNDEVADIRDNILNNLNPELVNHSILTRVSYSKSRCIADKQWVTGILIILFLL